MSPVGPGRPRDPDADAAILNAALELFLERGAQGTSLEQVAKRAGVAKLTLYRRWDSKEQLLASAIESSVEQSDDTAVFPSVEQARTIPLDELIEKLLPTAVDTMTAPRYPAMVAQALGSAVQYPSLMTAYWDNYVRPRRQVARVMLERARVEGRITDHSDLDVLIDMIVGALLYRVLQPGSFEPAEARRYLVAVYRQAGLLQGEPPDAR